MEVGIVKLTDSLTQLYLKGFQSIGDCLLGIKNAVHPSVHPSIVFHSTLSEPIPAIIGQGKVYTLDSQCVAAITGAVCFLLSNVVLLVIVLSQNLI